MARLDVLNPEDLVLGVRAEIEIAAERARWRREWHEEQPRPVATLPKPAGRFVGWVRRQIRLVSLQDA